MKSVLRKLVPNQVIVAVLRLKHKFNAKLIELCAKNAVLSSVYYLIFSKEFYREHQSVLLGRLAYIKSLQDVRESSYLLRRNIHRLEKGLIMRPRRPIFALNYIDETIKCYGLATASDVLCRDEIKWASDVLGEYFAVIEHTSHTQKLADRYHDFCQKAYNKTVNLPALETSNQFIPYPSSSLPELQVSTDALHALFMRRRSTRWFEPRRIEVDVLMKAIDMASTAPSACNRQPFQFKICSEPEIAQKIAKLAMGTSGFAENVQTLIVVVGDLSAYPFERDRHCIYIDSSLASMQLMLALETLGLSTCPINWPDIEGRELALQKALQLPGYLRPVMLMAVGYPDPEGGIPYSQKKPSGIMTDVVKN